MKTITIGFSSAKSNLMLFARAIEAVEKRPFSHVYVKYNDPFTGIDMIFQASHGMVNHCTFVAFESGNVVIKTYDFQFDDIEFHSFYVFMLCSLGIPYGWKDVLGIFFAKLIRGKYPFPEDKRTAICSKIGALVCKMKNVPLPNNIDSISPSDLDRILGDYNGKTQ